MTRIAACEDLSGSTPEMKKYVSFYRWMSLYHEGVMPDIYDNCVIGDIINDVMADRNFPKEGSLRECINYMEPKMPTEDARVALKIMTQFYRYAMTDWSD